MIFCPVGIKVSFNYKLKNSLTETQKEFQAMVMQDIGFNYKLKNSLTET